MWRWHGQLDEGSARISPRSPVLREVLQNVLTELDITMAMTGCAPVAGITPAALADA